jgi:uncharacterized protein (TIGR03435 family)
MKHGPKLASHTGTEEQLLPGYGSLAVKKGGMRALVELLSRQLGRVVIDRTGLKGEYDYALEWTPEPGQGGPESIGLPPDPQRAPPIATNGPSIFTALQEQLGLRLVSQKGPVEFIVIDRAERASGN